MLKFKKYRVTGTKALMAGKWLARPQIQETYDINALAEHMSAHNTPFSQGAIRGIIVDMVKCIRELVLGGYNVKLDDLAIFSVGFKCKPSDSADDFSTANIKAFRLRARATGQLSNANVNIASRVKEADDYSVEASAASPGGGSTTDKPSGGGGGVGDEYDPMA